MEKGQAVNLDIEKEIRGIPAICREVITQPKIFYHSMPKSGGFLQPLIFMVVLTIVSGLILSLLALLRLAPGGMVAALASLVIAPIIVAIFGFVAAAFLFVIWKMMGSGESYETAYRAMAYTAAIMPVTTLLNVIPYLGAVIGLVWVTYLLVAASTEVHGIPVKTALIGFGAICAVFVFMSVAAEMASRKMVREINAWEQQTKKSVEQLKLQQDMTPEEAGQAMGEFLRGLQKAGDDGQ